MINIYEFAGIRGYLFLDSLLFGNQLFGIKIIKNFKLIEVNLKSNIRDLN